MHGRSLTNLLPTSMDQTPTELFSKEQEDVETTSGIASSGFNTEKPTTERTAEDGKLLTYLGIPLLLDKDHMFRYNACIVSTSQRIDLRLPRRRIILYSCPCSQYYIGHQVTLLPTPAPRSMHWYKLYPAIIGEWQNSHKSKLYDGMTCACVPMYDTSPV
jgi:hypothetical protein